MPFSTSLHFNIVYKIIIYQFCMTPYFMNLDDLPQLILNCTNVFVATNA